MEKASNVLESEFYSSDFGRLANFMSKLQGSFILGVIAYIILAKLFIKEGTTHYDTYMIVIQVIFWTMLVFAICSSITMYMLGMDNDDLSYRNRQLREIALLRSGAMSDAEQKSYSEDIREMLSRQDSIMKSLHATLDKIEGYQENMHEASMIKERLETLQMQSHPLSS